ncbi:DNA-directed RNA polymerase subunit beta [bacterium]|nr:DNA-directed RNA polymerase subunit beta [bacterium]
MGILGQGNFRVRRWYGNITKHIKDIPDLLQIQKESYANFLQADTAPSERKKEGLENSFQFVFPIINSNNSIQIDFLGYSVGEPKYDVEECKLRGKNYERPIKIKVQLATYEIDPDTKDRIALNNITEQEIHFGEVPLMTDWGSFIISGTERVIVNQLHRSPGTFFDLDKNKSASGNDVFMSRLIPAHGSWLDFEFDSKKILSVKIDRKKKFPSTIFLKAWGYTAEDIIHSYYFSEKIVYKEGTFVKLLDLDNPEALKREKITVDILGSNGKVIGRAGKKYSDNTIKRLKKEGIIEAAVPADYLTGRRLYNTVLNKNTGDVLAKINDEVTDTLLEELIAGTVDGVELTYFENMVYSPYLAKTLSIDKVDTREDALLEIYKIMVPSNPLNVEVATKYFEDLFLDIERYDLSAVGRLRMNHKFGEDIPLSERSLRKEDVMNTLLYILNLTDSRGVTDDIDHLGNRRIRMVGELLQDTYKAGLLRMSHTIKEKLNGALPEQLTPYEVIGYKQVTAVVKEFFSGGQLSQFMDHTNVLSEMTHKRRLSALGPGGLAREHASFEVRDVHKTHYGRICPVETPEGPNVGLIVSLATFGRIDSFGYIEAPYRVVKKGKVTDTMVFLDAIEEGEHVIVPASTKVDKKGHIAEDIVNARKQGEVARVKNSEVTLMDYAPLQLVSVSAALIPFLEHDDANRALMGSNMQRQAVPLINTDAPLVGSGLESYVARDSGYMIYAKRSGIIDKVDAKRIVIRVDEDELTSSAVDVDIYNLIKYRRSNQNTCVNHTPLVRAGDIIRKGDVLADGPAMNRGELALGRNALIAFMPWRGYNFEDSILINQRLLREDMYTSIHIEEFVCDARDTKRGSEEITADIPNAPEHILAKLDESGIIRVGKKIKPGDILVGKVTPKGETVLSPEEKLLRAIFGEKAGDVRDSSLYVSSGVEGVVIDTRIFWRKGVQPDARMQEQEKLQVEQVERNRNDEIRIIERHTYGKIREMLVGKKVDVDLNHAKKDTLLLAKGTKITKQAIAAVPNTHINWVSVADRALMTTIREMLNQMRLKLDTIRHIYDAKIKQVTKNDDLNPGVIKSVKVFVAIKRKLSVGDKMSGRHGNKGVVSLLLPEEDMPFMEDGTTVDIVLNPLGVPSRMNIGQILEVHLGLSARRLGEQVNRYMQENWSLDKLKDELKTILDPSPEVAKLIDDSDEDDVREFIRSIKGGIYNASPVFDGAKEEEIRSALTYSGEDESGKMILFDGRTGEPFDSDVTVGIMHFLKLHHLVDEKVHARSTGPYSLVTQQPLGGKAQFGGQRLGEMEVWALEAYGAAYALQEFLTVKSDDVEGRKRLYEAIVRGKTKYDIGIPASFTVLVKEMQGLCLDVKMVEKSTTNNN